MADNTVVERIIDSLAFEVEALPQDNVLEISDTSKVTPLNLKIRVRKKDEALFEQGVVSVPKLGQPKKPPEQIRLVSSDQTVLSFQVFVDTHPDKKPAKKRKRFFGGCLSSEDNDDDPYTDSNPATASKSNDIVNQNFGLSKTKNVQDMQLQLNKPVMFLGNRCKPGGCLDPPLDEDKYSYEPNGSNFKESVLEHSETKKQHDLLTDDNLMKKATTGGIMQEAVPAKQESYKEEIESDNKSIQSIYKAHFIKSSLDAQHSVSIITYPPSEIADDIIDKPNSPKKTSGETRKSFPEFRDSYFIPPKSATNSRNNSDADKGTNIIETYFTGQQTTENKRLISKVEPEDILSLQSTDELQIISGIENKEIQNKTRTFSKETTNLGTEANGLQSEKDLQQLKEKKSITSALKTGAVLATPLLIAEAARQKIKFDKDNRGVQSEDEIGINSSNTDVTHSIYENREEILIPLMETASESITQSTFDVLGNDLNQKKEEEKSSTDENISFCERRDTITDFSERTKIGKIKRLEPTNLENKMPKNIHYISENNIEPSNEISRKTKEDDTSRDLNTQDYSRLEKVTDIPTSDQLTDQPSGKHSINEDYFSKDESDKGLQVTSHIEENKENRTKDENSQLIDHKEANKRKVSQTSQYIPDKLDKIRGAADNIREQAAKEKKNSFDCNVEEHEDVHKDQLEGSLRSSTYDKTNLNDTKKNFQHSNKALHFATIDANTQKKDVDQYSDKYQDADLRDYTYKETQSNDPLKNNARYNKDISDQRNIANDEINKDSNKYQYADSHFATKDADTQNKDINQDSDKYQDADLRDYSYKETQNNDPLENNTRYNKDLSDQHHLENAEINKDSNKAQYADSHFTTIDADTQNKEMNQDSDKYQDADLRDYSYKETQNNDPLENNTRYNENLSDQHHLENAEINKDSHKDQYADSHFATIDADTQNKEMNQDSDKYQDADLRDYTYKETQNNDPLENNARYKKDISDQRNIENDEINKDSNKYQYTDSHFATKDADTQNKDINQDSDKYQDADLRDYTYKETQNNDPLKNNTRYNKDLSDQHHIENDEIKKDSHKDQYADLHFATIDANLRDYTYKETLNNDPLENNTRYSKDISDQHHLENAEINKDSNKDQYADSHFATIDADTQNKEMNQDSDKYQDADLRDYTYKKTQNNDPLENNTRYSKDISDQHHLENAEINKDSNKDQYVDSHFATKDADTQNKDINQDSDKYQDADLRDYTYKETQNNDPLENNARYNKDISDQRNIANNEINEDSNKYQYADSSDYTFERTQNNDPLENTLHYKDKNNQSNTENDDINEVSNKYQNADRSDKTFGQIQNNDSFGNNIYKDKDKSDPQYIKNEEKNYESNKYQYADFTYDQKQNYGPLEHISRDIEVKNDQSNTKNDEKKQDSYKYQNADLSDKTFDQSQNNDPFENNTHYYKDKINQLDTKSKGKSQGFVYADLNARTQDSSENNTRYNKDKNNQHDRTKYEKNQDLNKYEDAELSDNTFDQTQNDYPLDKKYQRDIDHMLQFKNYQTTNAADEIEHDKVINSRQLSALQKQDKDTESTQHQVITPHHDKGKNIKEEKLKPSFKNSYDMTDNMNKTSETYDEHYKRTSVASNFVNMDISFHSYVNDQNESVIKTLDTLKEVKRRPHDNVTVIKSQIQLNTPYVLKIPFDNHRNMILEVKASDSQKLSSSQAAGADTRGNDNDENFAKMQQSQTSVREIESVQNLLAAIYEQQLLPLQSLISGVKKDVDILTTQQMWLKENWKRSKRPKTIRPTHSSRKCVCFKKLNVRK